MRATKKYVLLILLLCVPALAQAQQSPKVAVFPFDVFSSQPLETLKQQMQDMLRTRLEKLGLELVAPGKVNQALKQSGQALDLTLARRLAGDLGADFAVYGSLTKIGSRVSLDVKILDSLGMTRPSSSYVEGVGLDSLPLLSDQLAQEILVKVTGQEKVAKVEVSGNKGIENAAITAVIKTKAGTAYSPLVLDQDIRAIWKLGYFDDVQVKTADSPQGKIVTFEVTEKPALKQINVTGTKALDREDVVEQTGIKLPGIYRPGLLKEAEAKIIKLYHDKGYYDVKIKTEVIDLPNKDKGVKFEITEGEQVYISNIVFEGNKAYEDSTLRSEMTTAEGSWLSWFLEDNILKRNVLDQDREKVNDFYFNHGYLTARVGEPKITRGKDGLVVTFPVKEGQRFKVKSVELTGDLIEEKDKMFAKLSTKADDWFSRANVRKDMLYLYDLYADQGHAYVEVRPSIKENTNDTTVSIGFSIKQGRRVFFERVLISGNDATRDNVIRRQVGVAEGDLFSSTALRNTNMKLQNLNYFDDVRITTQQGSSPDRMDLRITVKEKRTGSLSAGLGYSTEDYLMLMGSAAENNLFGRGQRLELKANVGSKNTYFTLTFTEPWLFDLPLSFGAEIYNWQREYTSYDKDALGTNIRLGMPTGMKYTSFYTRYRFEQADVSGISDTASIIIQDQEGMHTTSSLQFTLRRDSRDHNFQPTKGSENLVSFEWAGGPLGGTNGFYKAIATSSWYFELLFKHVLTLHGRIGLVREHGDGALPIYERFFLGGMNTLRGFDRWSVGPKDPDTDDVIGGENMLQFNVEYRFPLISKAGIAGVVFYDTGNSWLEDDGWRVDDLRQSVGVGLRWYSPMGPLRLEYGYVLDPQDGESTSNWGFTVGRSF